MKKLVLIKWIVLLLYVVISCDAADDAIKETNSVPLNLTTRLNTAIIYDLGNFSVEGKTTITKQAKNFEISTLGLNDNTGKNAYFYTPKADFIGQDYVEIISSSSIGDGNFNSIVTKYLVTITINE